jgi:hypothetical protein
MMLSDMSTLNYVNTKVNKGANWVETKNDGYQDKDVVKMLKAVKTRNWDFRHMDNVEELTELLNKATGGREHTVNVLVNPTLSKTDPYCDEFAVISCLNIWFLLHSHTRAYRYRAPQMAKLTERPRWGFWMHGQHEHQFRTRPSYKIDIGVLIAPGIG